MIKNRPPRLTQIFADAPLFFVTFHTRNHQRVQSLGLLHDAFGRYAARAREEFNIGVGRYVIMPDHLHVFVRGGPEFELSKWINGLKRALTVAVAENIKSPLWQPGFFDHVLRNDENYAEKWNYVRENPVRAGLVPNADDWPYQGEIVIIDRA